MGDPQGEVQGAPRLWNYGGKKRIKGLADRRCQQKKKKKKTLPGPTPRTLIESIYMLAKLSYVQKAVNNYLICN
jgi:hypothetical protein